jgi:hypothetical protein
VPVTWLPVVSPSVVSVTEQAVAMVFAWIEFWRTATALTTLRV